MALSEIRQPDTKSVAGSVFRQNTRGSHRHCGCYFCHRIRVNSKNMTRKKGGKNYPVPTVNKIRSCLTKRDEMENKYCTQKRGNQMLLCIEEPKANLASLESRACPGLRCDQAHFDHTQTLTQPHYTHNIPAKIA